MVKEFNLHVDPLVSVDALKRISIRCFENGNLYLQGDIRQNEVCKMEGAAIQNDLGKLIYHFKDENETSVNIMQIMGVRHSVTLLNLQRL